MTDPLTAHDVVSRLLPEKLGPARFFEAYAPSNIALSKYWGKRNKPLNLPLNSSLSVSLADLGSRTKVMPAPDGQDKVWLNGDLLAPDSSFARKVVDFANLFRRGQPQQLHIKTTNTISTAAGLASSASGFAALTKALVGSFALELSEEQQSMIARLGSGSATRSFWHGFVRWERGELDDGSDSFARPLNHPWPEFRIAIIPVDTGPKAHSSRDGMQHTVSTSPLYAPWPERAEADCFEIEQAVAAQDFVRLGELAEANALAMHATMMAARPALMYLQPNSWAVLDRLWAARGQGLSAYATMDAGANIKLIFLKSAAGDVADLFPNAQIIAPFSHISK